MTYNMLELIKPEKTFADEFLEAAANIGKPAFTLREIMVKLNKNYDSVMDRDEVKGYINQMREQYLYEWERYTRNGNHEPCEQEWDVLALSYIRQYKILYLVCHGDQYYRGTWAMYQDSLAIEYDKDIARMLNLSTKIQVTGALDILDPEKRKLIRDRAESERKSLGM